MPTLALSISTALGPLALEDEANGYELHKDTFGTRNQSYRKTEVSGDWTEGTDVDRAVRENVVESVAVYVSGATHYQFATRLKALTDALEQLQYTITRQIGDLQEVWRCVPADYTVETGQELIFATMGLVRAQVPRKPAVTMTQVVTP